MNIYKSSGQYIGFIVQDNIFRWDGMYLGWIDNQKYIWDRNGNFRGKLSLQNGNYYALRNTFQVPPVSRAPRAVPTSPVPPTPSSAVQPVQLPMGVEDSF